MDIVFVRTRLQGIIAEKLLEMGEVRGRFILCRLHQLSIQEDHASVYEQYDRLSRKAAIAVNLVSSQNKFWNLGKTVVVMLLARVTGGRMFLAAINSFPIAVAHRIVRISDVRTFDDGAANVRSSSPYFSQTQLQRTTLARRVVNSLLPAGAASHFRRATLRHYTIFESRENIVPPCRLTALQVDWLSLLTDRDADTLRRRNIKSVLLGTVYHQFPVPLDLAHADRAFAQVDAYLPHPREVARYEGSKVLDLKSPAEAALQFLTQFGHVTVFHFGSTVADILAREANLTFVDLAVGNSMDPSSLGELRNLGTEDGGSPDSDQRGKDLVGREPISSR